MRYLSTRGDGKLYSASEVILRGLAEDGGLFVPESIPQFDDAKWQKLLPMSYAERAFEIMREFLDFNAHDLRQVIAQSYSEERFPDGVAKLVQLNKYSDLNYILELWHGPTAAFKDVALQLLPHLMTLAKEALGDEREYLIVTATSGDTGSAALDAFKAAGTDKVLVFYPQNGTSEIQEKQMQALHGGNCYVYAIEGNFDDAQTMVKEVFSHEELRQKLAEQNVCLSSANSINWGRLLPQIVYYCSTYLDLLKLEKLADDEAFDVVVPSGNFGNLLAAWYAKAMGAKINTFFCASNKNKVLTDFLRSGEYDRRRKLHKTSSPSMDILVSSNVERLVFENSGRNSEKLRAWMQDLKERGKYRLDKGTTKTLLDSFRSGFAEDHAVKKTIREVYDTYDQVVDPHTAVGFSVHERNVSNFKKEELRKTVFVATASPFKFPETVADALFSAREVRGKTVEELLSMIEEESGLIIPEKLMEAVAFTLSEDRYISVNMIPEIVYQVASGQLVHEHEVKIEKEESDEDRVLQETQV